GRGWFDGPVAFGRVQVRVTHAGGDDFHQSLTWTRCGYWHLLNDEGLAEFLDHCCLHSFSIGHDGPPGATKDSETSFIWIEGMWVANGERLQLVSQQGHEPESATPVCPHLGNALRWATSSATDRTVSPGLPEQPFLSKSCRKR